MRCLVSSVALQLRMQGLEQQGAGETSSTGVRSWVLVREGLEQQGCAAVALGPKEISGAFAFVLRGLDLQHAVEAPQGGAMTSLSSGHEV